MTSTSLRDCHCYREWNADATGYARFGLVSGLTVLDAEDGHLGPERWSYPLLADELRRWSARPDEDQRELFRRMVFNAMAVERWKDIYAAQGVDQRSLQMLEGAILPASFHRTQPPGAVEFIVTQPRFPAAQAPRQQA